MQRLAGRGFDRIPSAGSRPNSPTRSSQGGRAAGAVSCGRPASTANLAPVADVVPTALAPVNEPIGQLRRGYGPSPKVVAAKTAAFITGMDRADMATAVKHFPGLGRVRGNTDIARRCDRPEHAARRSGVARLPGERGRRRGHGDGLLGVYTRIDPERRAAFSPVIIDQLIRGDLGFDGVVISDDLAAAALQRLHAGRRAVGFVRAGGDLAIVGDPAEAATMTEALVAGPPTTRTSPSGSTRARPGCWP